MSGKILFLQPPSPPFMDVSRDYAGGFGIVICRNKRLSYGHDSFPFFNLSLASAAGVLERADYDVTFVDAQAECLDLRKTSRKVAEIDPQFVIALVNLPSIYADLELLKEVKHHSPNLKIICVGAICKVFPEIILRDDFIDFAVVSEPETTLIDLIDCLVSRGRLNDVEGLAFRHDGEIICTPPREILMDLDMLPDIPYHLLPMDKYRVNLFGENDGFVPILSSKGCPFKCAYYCPYPIGFGDRIRFRSPERVVQEINYLHEDLGVRQFIFRDQNFTFSAKHAGEICKLVTDKNLDIKWLCETRFDLVREPELLMAMRKAGCQQINFGLESGDPKLFGEIAKPGANFDRIKEVIKMVKNTGISAHTHLLIGLPGETWQTIRNTAQVLERFDVDSVQICNMIPYPGTDFHDEAKNKNLILTNDLAKYGGTCITVRTEKMSRLELALARLYLKNRLLKLGAWKQIPHLFKVFLKIMIEKTAKEFSLRLGS